MNLTRLEELRDELFLTKKDIANKLNVSLSIYARWENDKVAIPTKRLIEIAKLYNVNIDYILKLTNNKKKNTSYIINTKLISERIRKLRNELNMSLREIAKMLNTTSSTWSAYETDKTLILSFFLLEVVKKSNISSDYILGLSNNKYIEKEKVTI